jgi:hypothetical protein
MIKCVLGKSELSASRAEDADVANEDILAIKFSIAWVSDHVRICQIISESFDLIGFGRIPHDFPEAHLLEYWAQKVTPT